MDFLTLLMLAPIPLAWFFSAILVDLVENAKKRQEAIQIMVNAMRGPEHKPAIVPVYRTYLRVKGLRLRQMIWVADHEYFINGKKVSILGQTIEAHP